MYPSSDQNLNYETDEAVYFFTTAYDPFSNWSPHQVKIWGKTFPTLEHAYHFKKFENTAPKVAEQIMNAPSPWAANRVSRKHENKRSADWDEIKLAIMEELAVAKFTQHEDAQSCLHKTGSKLIVENSPWDNYWGSGSGGGGKNMMGMILMKVRDKLRPTHKREA